MLGGNGWKRDGEKVKTLPIFREQLVKHFYVDENGRFIFDDPIGEAPARPIGTKFVNTSFAHVHKNVLFVTIDAFYRVPDDQMGGSRYFDREKSSGGEGIITCTVNGDHLAWFKDVLIEARKVDSIKHIFVQAHIPILQPVRKTDCTGQFLDEATNSEFWKTMRQFNVDVYFGG